VHNGLHDLTNVDATAELFPNLADQRSLWALSGLDLAAWELPQQGKALVRPPLGKQHKTAPFDERGHHMQTPPWFLHLGSLHRMDRSR